jgi:hypothetical protein
VRGETLGAHSGHDRDPLERRRAERELFFWTAFTTLRLVAATAIVVYLIFMLIEGKMPLQGLMSRL